jgi:Ribbon-helix-helix protein, copG family
MKRTTIYLDPEIEVLLKLEAVRRGAPMSKLIRDALRAYLGRKPVEAPPGAGAFDSGHSDTAERAEDLLEELSFPEKD